jgi:comEA protein
MNQILRYISFTKNEIRVIIFLAIVILGGFAAKYISYKSSKADEKFDYAESDKKFLDYSRRYSALTNDSTDETDTAGIYSAEETEKIRKLQSSEDSLVKINGKKSGRDKKSENLKGRTININTAGKETLILLPGVGESTADKIILYRQEHNGFKKVQDIMKIKGIGKKKFENLKDFIVIE